MILESLWFRFDVSGKDILARIFAFTLAFVTTRIESQRGPVFLLLRRRFQFNQWYEFAVGATLASDAEKPGFFHRFHRYESRRAVPIHCQIRTETEEWPLDHSQRIVIMSWKPLSDTAFSICNPRSYFKSCACKGEYTHS